MLLQGRHPHHRLVPRLRQAAQRLDHRSSTLHRPVVRPPEAGQPLRRGDRPARRVLSQRAGARQVQLSSARRDGRERLHHTRHGEEAAGERDSSAARTLVKG